MTRESCEHNIEPVCDGNSRLLILGSFPSVRSRESGFFYGHPQNRFWKVLAAVYGEAVPADIPAKKALLLRHGVALWDVAARCALTGSADASIRDVQPNDLGRILNVCAIERIFAEQGDRPTAYIAGEEGAGAVVAGLLAGFRGCGTPDPAAVDHAGHPGPALRAGPAAAGAAPRADVGGVRPARAGARHAA